MTAKLHSLDFVESRYGNGEISRMVDLRNVVHASLHPLILLSSFIIFTLNVYHSINNNEEIII